MTPIQPGVKTLCQAEGPFFSIQFIQPVDVLMFAPADSAETCLGWQTKPFSNRAVHVYDTDPAE